MMRGMRVHSIDAIPIDIPLARNFGGSTYAVLKRSTVITRLATDEGLVSEVYNGDNREHGVEIARLIREDLAPRVRGFNVFEPPAWVRGVEFGLGRFEFSFTGAPVKPIGRNPNEE